jgi:hypothetical protein
MEHTVRIHTDNLNHIGIGKAFAQVADKAPSVTLVLQSEHGSRSHRRAYEIALRGHGVRHTHRPNSGVTGAVSDEYAATYDDWGWLASAVYALDASAKVGPYKSRIHFHSVTNNAYLP